MTVQELEDRMTWVELLEWSAFDEERAQDELNRKNAQANAAALNKALRG